MALPRLDVPLYELTLPSDGKKIKFRPFLVKEKKLFLLVREAQDIKDIINTVKQIIRNCIVQPEDVDPDDLAIVDIEYLFVNLRARSVGEVIELEFECGNLITPVGSDDPAQQGAQRPCGGVTKLKFNLLETEIEKGENHSTKVALTDKVGVCLKYPTFRISEMLEKESKDVPQETMDIILSSLEYVYDENSIYYSKDEKREDLLAWFENLTEDHFKKIMNFFESAPQVVGKSNFKCVKCGYEEAIKLKGIQDFFG
jgi:hypothetical protein